MNINPQQLVSQLSRFRGLVTIVAIVGLLGYTAYQVSLITGVQPDAQYLSHQRASAPSIKLKISRNTIDKLKALQSAGDTTVPVGTSKNDPFSLN